MRLTKRLTIKYIRTKFKLLSAISKRKTAEEAFILFTTPQHRVTKVPPEIFNQGEKLHFTFHGATIRGYRWNHPSPKKVLIIHGFESSIINFDQYVRPLINRGFEVLGFDAPAHGRSTGKRIDVVLYKDFIKYICKHYGPIKYYTAHSLGGLALSHFLEEVPHDDTFRVVFIAPATETITAIQNFFKFLQLDDEVRKQFDKVIKENGRHPPEWFSVARACEHIKAQVLWLQDKEDRQTPFSDVKPIMEKRYPNFKFRLTKGLGHRKIYHHSNSRKAIIEFLDR